MRRVARPEGNSDSSGICRTPKKLAYALGHWEWPVHGMLYWFNLTFRGQVGCQDYWIRHLIKHVPEVIPVQTDWSPTDLVVYSKSCSLCISSVWYSLLKHLWLFCDSKLTWHMTDLLPLESRQSLSQDKQMLRVYHLPRRTWCRSRSHFVGQRNTFLSLFAWTELGEVNKHINDSLHSTPASRSKSSTSNQTNRLRAYAFLLLVA